MVISQVNQGKCRCTQTPAHPMPPHAHPNTTIFSTPAAVGMAIGHVNQGKCREALDLLDLLISSHPTNVGALAARGTARALLGRLQGGWVGAGRGGGARQGARPAGEAARWVGGNVSEFGWVYAARGMVRAAGEVARWVGGWVGGRACGTWPGARAAGGCLC